MKAVNCSICGQPVTIRSNQVAKLVREGKPITHRRCGRDAADAVRRGRGLPVKDYFLRGSDG